MFKCEWLKKLLGFKKECCCHSEKMVNNNQENTAFNSQANLENKDGNKVDNQ